MLAMQKIKSLLKNAGYDQTKVAAIMDKILKFADEDFIIKNIVIALTLLNDLEIATPININVVLSGDLFYALRKAQALVILQAAGILNSENCAVINNHKGDCIAGNLVNLFKADILTDETRKYIADNPHWSELSKIIIFMYKKGVKPLATMDWLSQPDYCFDDNILLKVLSENKESPWFDLSVANFLLAFRPSKTKEIFSYLARLNQCNLDKKYDYLALLKCADLETMWFATSMIIKVFQTCGINDETYQTLKLCCEEIFPAVNNFKVHNEVVRALENPLLQCLATKERNQVCHAILSCPLKASSMVQNLEVTISKNNMAEDASDSSSLRFFSTSAIQKQSFLLDPTYSNKIKY